MSTWAKAIDPRKIAIYIRWSTEDQGEGTTLEVQREACVHYLRSQGWEVTPHLTFVDDGHSGGTLNRPALAELRRQVRSGQVQGVVVYKLDRLSRSVVDTVSLVLDEWEGRAFIKSAREAIDTATPAGKMFFYLLASYAEWERNVIRERTMAGKLRRAQEGRNPGFRIPYGYRTRAPGELAVLPDQAEVVRGIFRDYLEEQSTRRIAINLNARGLPSPRGGSWSPQTVTGILKNRVYLGDVVYGRLSVNPRRQKDPSEPFFIKHANPLVVRNSPHIPAIVAEETFHAVQELLASRRPDRTACRALSTDHLLSGLLRCRCGGAMAGATVKRKTREYRYYICIRKRDGSTSRCASGLVPQEAVFAALWAELQARLGTGALRQRHLDRLLLSGQDEAAAVRAGLQRVEQEAAGLAEQGRRLNRDYRTGTLPAPLYAENKRELAADEARLAARKATLEEQLARLLARRDQAAATRRAFSLLDAWDTLDNPARKGVLRHFLWGATAFRAPGSQDLFCEFHWKLGEEPPPAPAPEAKKDPARRRTTMGGIE